MRDRRFVAEHRGGTLDKVRHRQLIRWACDCVAHVLPFYSGVLDERLEKALKVAIEWEEGRASVGDARNAALGAIAVANELSDPASVLVARSIGHAVACAHMADHSLGAALYALKAVRTAGSSLEEERSWQNEQLSREIKDLIQSARIKKEKALGLWE